MNETMDNKYHYIVGILLGIVGLLIILIFVSLNSQADDNQGTASTTISNTAPTITAISLSGSGYSGGTHTGVENTTTSLVWSITYTDSNTCDEVENSGSFVSKLALTSAIGSCTTGSTDYLDCYEENSYSGAFTCTNDCTGTGDTEGTITCTFPLEHYVIDGTWTASTSISDGSGGAVSTSTTFTVAKVTALELVDTVIDFGTLALGAESNEATTIVRNYGNDNGMGISVYTTDMNCSASEDGIDASQMKVSSSTQGNQNWDSTAYLQLTTTTQSINATLGRQTVSTTESSSTLYWALKIPASGVSGTCSSTVTVVGVAS
jgi:hypothetical protein